MSIYRNLADYSTLHADLSMSARRPGPQHIARFTDPIFLRVIERSLTVQAARLTNPDLRDSHAEAQAGMNSLGRMYRRHTGREWRPAPAGAPT